MKSWIEADDGVVKISEVCWISPVRPVKVTRGGVETVVFNFLFKAGFHCFKSLDFQTSEEAELAVNQIKEAKIG